MALQISSDTVQHDALPLPLTAPPRSPTGPLGGAVVLFGATMLLGSGLLFLVQPMFAKLVLPRLGGSPAVWNTCMLFFQTVLLLGYLYAHFSTRWLGVRRQAIAHFLVILLPVVVLPITLGSHQPAADANPAWWLLGTMTVTVGLPFFAVSTSAPLLQRWFSTLPLASARDPYFLYAASNAGSMFALLGYPLLLEPAAGTRHQTWLWAAGYAGLVLATAACAALVRMFGRADEEPARATIAVPEPVTGARRVSWIGLAFIPSSLMLGVTTYISTDIAAVPLLWVLPLALYLGTFILAFSTRQVLSHRWLARVLPLLIFGSLLTVVFNAGSWLFMLLHLLTFFVVAMVCHRRLADRRPGVHHLTEFYIWLSFGGMLGGVFNSLVAPALFSSIVEYPLVLALAALFRPSPGWRNGKLEPVALLVGLPAFVLLASLGLWAAGLSAPEVGPRLLLVSFSLILAAAFVAANRPVAFGAMAVVIVAIIPNLRPATAGEVLYAGRSFFGVHRVVAAPDRSYHLLQHGSTAHGRQQMPAADSCDPTGYYHPAGPAGAIFGPARARPRQVAVVGLGTGALACYARLGERWTFFEIDPLVEAIARENRYFTYLQNAPGEVHVVLGDGRIALASHASGLFDLIVLDAFSSDAIPVHLLTREAIQLYLSRLAPEGTLVFHISNRYLVLEPVLAALVEEHGLRAVTRIDTDVAPADLQVGRIPSHWIAVTRPQSPAAALPAAEGWEAPRLDPAVRPWTDDYSNLLRSWRGPERGSSAAESSGRHEVMSAVRAGSSP